MPCHTEFETLLLIIVLLLLLWLPLLISFWYLCGPYVAPQWVFLWGHMEDKRSSFGTFRQPQPHEALGNVKPPWTPLLQPGLAQAEQDMEYWGQGAGWLELGHGVWALGGEQDMWEQFLFPSSERIQWYLIQSVRALVTKACCDHSRLQHNSVPSLTAPPSDKVPMLSWWWQRGDQTVCERQSNPSFVIILVHLRGCMTVMGELSKSSAWCAAKGRS